jgi:hypothetical protein
MPKTTPVRVIRYWVDERPVRPDAAYALLTTRKNTKGVAKMAE